MVSTIEGESDLLSSGNIIFPFSSFLPTNNILSKGFDDFHTFVFQWAFAATAATILSGSVADRTSFYAYMAYAFVVTAFAYPIVSHGAWCGGFLSTIYTVSHDEKYGAIDSVVFTVFHMVGGFAGLTGAIVVGPMLGRFDSEECCTVHKTVTAATGAVFTFPVSEILDIIFHLLAVLNELLSDFVSVIARRTFVEVHAAIITGAIVALLCIAAAFLILKFKTHESSEAFSIHGAVGLRSAIAPALINRKRYKDLADLTLFYHGAFTEVGLLAGPNVAVILVVILWTVGLILPLFSVMNAIEIVSICPEKEIISDDVSNHGGVAYPIEAGYAAEKAAQHDIDHLCMDNSLKEGLNHPV